MVNNKRIAKNGRGVMKIIPYGHQWIDEKDIEEVIKVLKSDWITQGPKVKEFENALCKYTGAKYVVAVSSGTSALHIACLATGIRDGDEAITSPITFVASANCVLYCGGKPIFVDIQEDTVNINPKEIKKKITSRTKAIIPVHFAGHPCDLEEIHEIAKKYNLLVIEDATHALGAEYKDSKIGSCKYSDMTIFSFHPVKSITMGEGGAVLTNKKELYDKLLMLRNHGITNDQERFINKKLAFTQPATTNPQPANPWYYEMQELGFNYRITDFQCALGLSQLKKLDGFIQKRRKIAKIYENRFKNNDFFDLPQEKDYTKSSWHLYPVKLKDKYKEKKSLIFNKLREKGLGVQVHYIPVYLQLYYQKLGYKRGICPNAEDFYQKQISIPLYQSMSTEDINYVVNRIFKVFKGFR